MSKILVTGATGTCGSETVRQLRRSGVEVRAGVRSKESAANLAALGAELVLFDLDRPETLRPAFSGVERAFFITPFVEKPLPMLEAGLEAARAEGVGHVLRLSAAGADPSGEAKLPREHGLGERLVERSGLSWTVIRPTFFMDNFANFQAPAIASTGKFYGASHDGKVAYVSARDVGAVAAAILAAPEPHAGNVYELTGAEALSDAEVAERMGDVLRKAVEYVDLEPERLAAGLRSQGTPDWMVEDLLFLEGVKAAGWAATISPAVAEITGKEPETFESFLARNEERFA